MAPSDLDPAKVGRDDDDPTSPSSSDSGDDDWDNATPLTDTMDQERVDKIDSIMQGFCAALESKLVLVKQEKPSSSVASKREKDDASGSLFQEDHDEEETKEKKSDKGAPPKEVKTESKLAAPNLKGAKMVMGLPLLPKKVVPSLKKKYAKATAPPPATSSPGPSAPTGIAGAQGPKGAFRLASRSLPAAPEAAVSATLAPAAPSSAPPPPPPPTRTLAPAPAPTPVASASTSVPIPPPVPPPAARQSTRGAPGGGGPPRPPPTILPSNANLFHNQFIHLASFPPVSNSPLASPPSPSPPGLGAAAQNLQQAASRPPVGVEHQNLRSRPSPGTQFRRFFQSSSRSSASQEQVNHAVPPFVAAPPTLQWQPPSMMGATGLFDHASFGGPQVRSRGLDQDDLLSPDFNTPFPGQSPFDPPHDHFAGDFAGGSLQSPGAIPPGELYPSFPAPEPGGSRRQYQFGPSPNPSQHDNDGSRSRKSSAVSPFPAGSSSPAAAAVQPALDKAPDRDGRRKRQKATDDSAPKSGEKKFACPYYKRNRKKYCKWTSCPGPGWEEVHRVKTHLYRRHGRPPQCPRCWAVFSTEEALQIHQQQNPPCETSQNMGLVEGFSKEQEKKLRSRKKAQPNMTDEDKWSDIYMILFPDDDKDSIPSPYYDDADGADQEEGGTSADSPGGELEDYAAFVRREMPTLVRRELEVLFQNEFKDIDEKLRPKVAKIVLDLQPKLLNLYKQSQLPLSEYGLQNSGQTGVGHTPGSSSEPGMASTISPISGADFNSTPGGIDGNLNDGGHGSSDIPYYEPTSLDFDINNMGTSFTWDGTQYQIQTTTANPSQYQGTVANDGTGLGLDWNYEFGQLLSTDLLTHGQGADANEWGKRKYDGN